MEGINFLKRKTIRMFLICSLLLSAILLGSGNAVLAAESKQDAEKEKIGDAYLVDYADLFTPAEEEALLEAMQGIRSYGGVALVTNPSDCAYSGSASAYTKSLCLEYFGDDTGMVLMIDMYNRRIEFAACGSMKKYLTDNRFDGIADNIYTYATKEEYATCAKLGLEQCQYVLEGGKLSVPLRHVSNLLIAIGVALLGCFLVAYFQRTHKKMDALELQIDEGTAKRESTAKITIFKNKMVKQRKTSNSSSSSGGSSGGGGGGGGGGCSGGGHSF